MRTFGNFFFFKILKNLNDKFAFVILQAFLKFSKFFQFKTAIRQLIYTSFANVGTALIHV